MKSQTYLNLTRIAPASHRRHREVLSPNKSCQVKCAIHFAECVRCHVLSWVMQVQKVLKHAEGPSGDLRPVPDLACTSANNSNTLP